MEEEKKWIYWKNTEAVTLKLKKDLIRISTAIDIFVQLLFLVFYVYNTIKSLGNTVVHILYASFFIVGFLYFIFHLISYKFKNKELRKKVRRVVRYIKYPIRLGILIFSFIACFKNTGVDTGALISTIISTVSFVFQIFFQVIINFISRYVNMIAESVKMDYEQSRLVKAVVNSAKKTNTEEKKFSFGGFLKKTVKNAVDGFIENNGGNENTQKEEMPAQSKRRNLILKLKEKFVDKKEKTLNKVDKINEE